MQSPSNTSTVLLLSLAQQMSVHIKSLRRAQGLTQQGLASLIGVGQARMAAIEKTPGAVSLDQMLQIVHALNAKLQLVVMVDMADKAGIADMSNVPASATAYLAAQPVATLRVAEATPISW